jgi:chromosome segregation ATPase
MPNNKQINVSAEAYSAILSAIEQVFANTGKKPKYSEVQAIYKTSNSYIQHVMTEWLKEHQDELNSPSTQVKKPMQLDDETIKALSNSFVVEVQKAKDEADAELEQERKALYVIRDEALDEMQAQMNIADERLDEINELTATRIAQAQKVLELESAVSDWKLKHDDLLAVNKRQSDDIQRTESRNSVLEADLADTRKQLNTAQSEATSYKMQFNEVTKRAERLTTELDNKSKQLNERDNTISKLSTESLEDKRSIATLEGNNKSLEQTKLQLEQQLKKSNDEFRQAQDDNAALKGANAKLEAEYKELENRHSNTSKERDQANERISALQQQLELSKKQNK